MASLLSSQPVSAETAASQKSSHREPFDGLLPDQLPEGILWSVTLPIGLEWLDEPGAEELARTATRKARGAMRR